MSASDALSALKVLYDVANKVRLSFGLISSYFNYRANQVKDNKDELIRLSRRIEHIVITIEESKNRDVIRPGEYNDALTTISKSVSTPFPKSIFNISLLSIA